MEDITEAVVKAVDKIPVTVKMRAGWNSESIVSTQAGVNLEKIGVKETYYRSLNSSRGRQSRF